MLSSSDLHYDSYPSPSAASAALPAHLASTTSSAVSAVSPLSPASAAGTSSVIRADLISAVSAAGAASYISSHDYTRVNESTSLLTSRVDFDYESRNINARQTQLVREARELILLLEKIDNSRFKIGYYDLKNETSCISISLLILSLFAGVLSVAIWSIVKSNFDYTVGDNYNKLLIRGNSSGTCNDYWPLPDYSACKHSLTSFINREICNTTLCEDLVNSCLHSLKQICEFKKHQYAYIYGGFVGILVSTILLIAAMSATIGLMFVINDFFAKVKSPSFQAISSKYTDRFSHILQAVDLSTLTLSQAILKLKSAYPEFMMLANFDEILYLENVTISKKTAEAGEFTYFAALKQDASLLKPSQEYSGKDAGVNPHYENSFGQRLIGLFYAAPQKPQASPEKPSHSVTPLACGNDVNDIIFSYALGRKYSSV